MLLGIVGSVVNVSFERLAAVLLAATLLALTLASGVVDELAGPARQGRWVLLLALAAVAVVLAVRVAGRGALHVTATRCGAVLLIVLAVVSAAWSVDPDLTLGRAASFAVLLVAAAALAVAARRPVVAELVALVILSTAAVVALLGAALAALDPDQAIQAASLHAPARLRGIGENPNTVPMLLAVAVPFGTWWVVTASGRTRSLAGAVLLLLYGSIAFSGSRGALVAALVGSLVATAALDRSVAERAAAVTGVVALFGVATLASQIPQPAPLPTTEAQAPLPDGGDGAKPGDGNGGGEPGGGNGSTTTDRPGAASPPPSVTTAPPPPPPPPGGGRLEDELGRPAGTTARRTLFQSSGRGQAWEEAVRKAAERPLLGYGFGTEDRVFFERIYYFQGRRPENSLIGIGLQLGAAGALALLGIAVAAAVATVRGLRGSRLRPERRALGLAFAGAAATGIVFALVQSYVYAAGNLAALAVWLSLFVAADTVGAWGAEDARP